MAKTISIGAQDFEELRVRNCFYVDKTDFIREWWDNEDIVTLITRPRRFGKTLNMNMVECFFSNEYDQRADLFEGLSIWENKKYRELQGIYPVIAISFAGIKQTTYDQTRMAINKVILSAYDHFRDVVLEQYNDDRTRARIDEITKDMDDSTAATSLKELCALLEKIYGKKCIILLDEYDTPMQEAYIHGFWDELAGYMRSLFNNTFKTNPFLGRALITGITRISKESIFSDLNNLIVVTTTSDKYARAFGFTEDEVFTAIREQGYLQSACEDVKHWYDGFTFGRIADIYNPWSITCFLKEGKFGAYWADTSSNGLVGHLLQTGDPDIKMTFENLLKGECLKARIDEQIVFSDLDYDNNAVWSLLMASGYLKVVEYEGWLPDDEEEPYYTLSLTNHEVKMMFYKLIRRWFAKSSRLNPFVKAMLTGDVEGMNDYMNDIALETFSSFDSGKKPSRNAPERFYHGFVLGLLVEQSKDYLIRSNRESGRGRYDVVMEPKHKDDFAVIMEFKVMDERRGEKDLYDTVCAALDQIEEMKYDTDLLARGILADHIYKYGFAFRGSECLINMA